MNVPPPSVQYYVLDTSKPPPIPSSSVNHLSVLGPSSSAACVAPPPPSQSKNYALPITLSATTPYVGGYTTNANGYAYASDFSLPPPPVVIQQQPDFSQLFSIPPPPLPNASLVNSQIQQQQSVVSDNNNVASNDVRGNGHANHNHYKDIQNRINRYRKLGERSRLPLDALRRPRRSKRRKNAAYHQEIFQQFQRNFEKFNHDDDDHIDCKSKRAKCDEESRIPACYRLRKASIGNNIHDSDSSGETSLSDGEVKSDHSIDSTTDQECGSEKRLQRRSVINDKLNVQNLDEFPSYYDNAVESSVSETEEEDANFGEKQSDTAFVQSTNAKLYYTRDKENFMNCLSTNNLKSIQNLFESRVVNVCRNMRMAQPHLPPLPEPQPIIHKCHHHTIKVHHRHQTKKFRRKNSCEHKASISSSSQSDSDNLASSCSSDASENENVRFKSAMEAIRRKEEHPARLHRDIWFNEKGQMNDGPLCRCSWKARRSGIAHSLYPGEKVCRSVTCAENVN